MGDSETMDGGEAEPATARNRAESLWHLRPWLFAGLLGVAGLAIHLLLHHANDSGPRVAGAAFIAFACGAFVFTAERGRYLAPAIFSLVTGLIVGGLTWRAVGAGNDIADGGYAIAAGVFACLLAVPLLQADFLHRRMRTDYRDIHYFVWTDAITGAGAVAFFLIAWLLIWLLASLFDLVGIPLRDLVQQDWFTATYAGLTLGAGLGTLRNQLKIIGTLQSVVLLVLSILALPLAVAIAVFLGAVVVSGPSVLWNATDSATPVLLSIAIGAYVLANAVLRDRDTDMVGGPVLKWSGYALALGILPLTVFAAISTGVRIDQHGLSPERLWAVCSLIVAVAFGLAYFVDALVGARGSWRDRLRASNLKLGLATALFALFLALPVLNFGAISTSDQLARLKSGAISVDEFDFSALRWDFGEPGREALARLAESERTHVAELAQNTLQLESKPYGSTTLSEREEISEKADLSGLDDATARAVRAFLRDEIILCREGCRVETLRASPEGVLIALMTKAEYAENPHLLWVASGSAKAETQRVYDGKLVHEYEGLNGPVEYDGNIELRPFEGQQIFVDGKPASQPFK
ncbi:DUF4153 domain-containing protein [Erythrobacter sp. YJ-T3-07]|uniref:DUF4153 domain-containing protein n=1 Tax=Erythrobacter sp. YJ-T3-07 TaxID=2793063 RepID=UPI0018D2DCF2|nr:DUF4153 domain-containing protein [Erythrobacter sp. YJ-T3-07]MBH1944809.1 DUF4153 domain-containing protein [Erythrobacter sp. YJ-T3-07]